ncbi:MAG: FtsX-like permease family protein [Candidatus Omnitrophota bacterium]|jgi:ABC-type lipoprotein release transport system permease subunit
MFWIIAWRNILAKKRRSIITISLSAVCTAFLIFALSFMDGQHVKMIKDAVEIFTGYIQVAGNGYQDNPDYDHLIFDLDNVKNKISGFPEIKAAAARFQTFALFAGEEGSAGGALIGIEPMAEKKISRIASAVTSGEYLEGDGDRKCIIGKKLAQRLNLNIGDDLTYISQSIDMSIAADILKISGIFATGSQMDYNTVFVDKKYMDGIFQTDNIASQYVLLPLEKFRGGRLGALVASIDRKLIGTGSEAVSWKVPLKPLLQLLDVDSAFGYFSYGILVVVVFFVVMIFFLINIFQMTREIGIMRAVGTTPRQVLVMLVAESVVLGLIAVTIGGIIGGLLVHHYNINPIEFKVSKEILEQYQKWGVIDMMFPTVFSYASIIHICLFVLLLNILAVLYPAITVNRYKPIDAIHYV